MVVTRQAALRRCRSEFGDLILESENDSFFFVFKFYISREIFSLVIFDLKGISKGTYFYMFLPEEYFFVEQHRL